MSRAAVHHATHSEELGDFTTTVQVLPICLLAIGIGFIALYVAWFLLKLIGLFTNLFYYASTRRCPRRPAITSASLRSLCR